MGSTRVAVITDSSSGIGLDAAKRLAAADWRVIATGRDPELSAAAERAIRAASTSGQVDLIHADFSRISDTLRTATEILRMTDRIDVLINNAGSVAREKVITEEGFEENFVGNHLGPFLLTLRLLPILQRTARYAQKGSVRIINTSSSANEMINDLPWGDLQMMDSFDPAYAYCNTKLANILFMRGLAADLEDVGVIAHTMLSEVVASDFINDPTPESQSTIRSIEPFTPEVAADTLFWLATDREPGLTTGGYFCGRASREVNPVVENKYAAERLWRESEKLLSSAGL